METSTFVDLIGSLGFPIACVIALGFFIYQLWRQSAKRETKLYEELAECRSVNKMAIETLTLYAERLGVIEADVKEIKNDIITIVSK